jgi:hypothetical protein
VSIVSAENAFSLQRGPMLLESVHAHTDDPAGPVQAYRLAASFKQRGLEGEYYATDRFARLTYQRQTDGSIAQEGDTQQTAGSTGAPATGSAGGGNGCEYALLKVPVTAGLSNQRISLVAGLVLAALWGCKFAVLPLVVKYTLNGHNPSSLSLYHHAEDKHGLHRLSELLSFDTYFNGDMLAMHNMSYNTAPPFLSGLRILRSLPAQLPSRRVVVQPWPKTLDEARRTVISAPVIEMPAANPAHNDWVVDWSVTHDERVNGIIARMFMAVSLSKQLAPTAVSQCCSNRVLFTILLVQLYYNTELKSNTPRELVQCLVLVLQRVCPGAHHCQLGWACAVQLASSAG